MSELIKQYINLAEKSNRCAGKMENISALR